MLEARFKPRNGKVVAEEFFDIKSNLRLLIGTEAQIPEEGLDGEAKLGKIITDFSLEELQGKICIQSGHPEIPANTWIADYRSRKLVDRVSHQFAGTVHIAGTNDEYVIGPHQALVSPGFYGCQAIVAVAGETAYFKHNRDTRIDDGIEFLERVLAEKEELECVTLLSNEQRIANQQRVLISKNSRIGVVKTGIVDYRPFRFWALNNLMGQDPKLVWAVTPEYEGRQASPKLLPVNFIGS
jgi:hypothetical protein